MIVDPLSRLTDGQRDCLRRVLEHKSSKVIARELNISRFTVDKRIEAAMEILGVASRVEAARLVAESREGYERFVCEPALLGDEGSPGLMAPTQPAEGPSEQRVRDVASEAGNPGLTRRPARRPGVRWPLPSRGRERYDLSTIDRLIWTGAIALAVILIAFLAFAAAESLQRTLQALVR